MGITCRYCSGRVRRFPFTYQLKAVGLFYGVIGLFNKASSLIGLFDEASSLIGLFGMAL